MIYLLRHAQTLNNLNRIIQGRIDFPLSESGKEYIKVVGSKFKKKGYIVDLIYSSPLKRAYESALIMKDSIGYLKDIIIYDNLIEREFGEAEGLTLSKEIYDRILNDDFKGMEKCEEVIKRGYNAVLDIARQNKDKNILIVCHSHVIKGVLIGIDKTYKFSDTLENCSLTILDYVDDSLNIVEANKELYYEDI